jgi:alpha-mannosidase
MLAAALSTSAVADSGENAAQRAARTKGPRFNLDEQRVLYCIGYAHLDTQWRWDFPITIDRFVRDTLEQNFARFEQFPAFTFNFTGSVRYEMMAEYYPELYERLKQHIANGRWFVSGSSVDEGDVNVPSAEAVMRQVLYGNRFFKREFGKESLDFMLPDCFGFPASMPSIWAHCGLLGFSTQKLTWGSAVGIPFKIGVWEGPDGASVIAALDPGSYAAALEGRVDLNEDWIARVEQNGQRYGVFADYHYYGVGDQGGAPREEDVKNYTASIDNPDSKFHVELSSSDQLYRDITPAQRARLPRYKGDMLLTEHSAGTLTSQSYMKRWNRMGEQLADAAERAAVNSWWLGATAYPRESLERSWVRLLANQMHDILPGTSIPVAYTWSWNDEIVAMNGFAETLTESVGAMSRALDTRGEGVSLVVYNPLAIEREDIVTATVTLPRAQAVRVFGPDGSETPSQTIRHEGEAWELMFVARAPSVGHAVYDVRPAGAPYESEAPLQAGERTLENEHYRVTVNDAGDLASVYDKTASRELLAAPARLVFTHESPRSFPAWNMDWEDRQHPPIGAVEGPATIRVSERGPVRVALEVSRESRGSIIKQTLRLCRGDAGRVVEIASDIDWQSSGVALKASFPLTVSNPIATYNWGLGVIERGNNEPVKYEVPSHEWFDLTDADGSYGVSVLEDSKFGSDKPADNEVRLTLLYSPEVRHDYMDQHSQDWGRHDIVYGLYGHAGDWRTAHSEWRGRRLNQPLKVFVAQPTAGALGKSHSLLSVSTPQVDVRAVKLAEDRDEVIVRLQELWGRRAKDVRVTFASPISAAHEVDGQERRIGPAIVTEGALVLDMTPYSPRSFALTLGPPPIKLAPPHGVTVAPPCDTDAVSSNANRADGAIDQHGRTLPAEQLPQRIVAAGVTFELGSQLDGDMNAVSCRGQEIALPDFGDRVHFLAAGAADDDIEATFHVGEAPHTFAIQPWTGFVGQWNTRVFDRPFKEIDYNTPGRVVDILPSFIRRDPIAWFATHHHDPRQGDRAYRFSYLFAYDLPRSAGSATLRLPMSPRVKIFAVSVSEGAHKPLVAPAAPLYDDFTGRAPVKFRYAYPPPPAPVFTGAVATGAVTIDRADAFDALSIGAPTRDDFVDAASGSGVRVRAVDRGSFHPSRGASLARFNDGELARHNDDVERCVWSDRAGRFYCDLGEVRRVQRINSYSWHRSNRAPQYYSVWGAIGAEMPDPGFNAGDTTGWTLLGVVDSRRLGHGGTHGASVHSAEAGADLGQYRYLLWVTEDSHEGTFFTEVDVYVAP